MESDVYMGSIQEISLVESIFSILLRAIIYPSCLMEWVCKSVGGRVENNVYVCVYGYPIHLNLSIRLKYIYTFKVDFVTSSLIKSLLQHAQIVQKE